MRRVASQPRDNWREKVEEVGLLWHSGAQPYWNESAFYEFTARDIEMLESATNELAEMALRAAEHVIDVKSYARMGIPENAVPLIERSWESEPPSLFGRFDLSYDGVHPPKLLEYNADTPTSLIEAAVAQWHWLRDTHPRCDQFNSIHERLIDRWRELAPYLPQHRIDFCSMDDVEDGITATYLLDTAQQAGLAGSIFPIDEIGWNGEGFVGPDGRFLTALFKLYPWEWMVREEFARYLTETKTIFIEPPWKLLLSNKGILPVLWELYPGHPNLLEAHFERPASDCFWVEKPLLGREGSNIKMHLMERDVETGGDYGEEGFVYQQVAPLMSFHGKYPAIGSWVIGDTGGAVSAGIGIRESDTPIVTNTSQFIPHLFC